AKSAVKNAKINNMEDSMAHPPVAAGAVDLPAWKSVIAVVSAVILGFLFIVAGVWKITDPFGAATRMNQALLPAALSLPAALAFGVAETFAGVLLFVPRFRRWGSWLTGLLLVAFLGYFAVNYTALQGQECSCFPWLKRAVGPG